MALVAETTLGWHLSHESFLRDTYEEFGLASKPIFEMLTPFLMDGQAAKVAALMRSGEPPRKKRKKKPPPSLFKEEKVLLFSQHLKELRSLGIRHDTPDADLLAENNRPLRRLVEDLEDQCKEDLGQDEIIVPPGAQYRLEEITPESLLSLGSSGRRFSVVLLDPPWENKHVRRQRWKGKGYHTMPRHSLDNLLREMPLGELLAEKAVVLVWCGMATRERALQFIEAQGLEAKAEWLWLKVTKNLEPVVPDDHPHKETFELVVVGTRGIVGHDCRDQLILSSVPSGVQSHKPPLVLVLRKVFPEIWESKDVKCLELFGRYLVPDWTTVGNECLKFQQLHYFEKVASK